MLNLETLANYWSAPLVAINALVFLNLLGALLLGLLVGYERSYHGRAAGMRTYGLVCMASTALTVIGGYSAEWVGGASVGATPGDITRVIQGIVTGIGFLCAGVIMREGFNISGLTTAASLWATAVIGILVGVGFYAAAMSLALLSAICMAWISRVENWLPSRQAVAITLHFSPGAQPDMNRLRATANRLGYEIAAGTVAVSSRAGNTEWRFVVVARSRKNMVQIPDLAREIAQHEGVIGFDLAYARN